MEFRRDASMLNVSGQGPRAGPDAGRWVGWVPAEGLFPLRIRYLCWGALPGAGKAIGTPPIPRSALLLAPQDELSHINARLNMGILGCECGPPAARPAVPRPPDTSYLLSLCSL